MRAVQVSETGGPEVLEVVDLPDPQPGPGRLLVAVATAGVNFVDIYVRDGLYPHPLPCVLGQEGAGEILAVGPGVDDFTVGDQVAWADGPGSYAELVSLAAERAVRLPAGVKAETATALMVQGLTAHYLATSTFRLEAGHRCLVHAGAGGVGNLLIQIAKKIGAEVFTTVGSPEKAEVATAAGADHVIPYREIPFVTAVTAIAGDRPLDVVYDGIGAATFAEGLKVLKRRGTMVSFGNASGPVEPISPLELSRNGSLFLTRPTLADHIQPEELAGRWEDLMDWLGDESLEVLIGERFALEQAADAHRALEGRLTTGKVLLVP